MRKLDVNQNTITYSSTQTRPEGGRAIPAQVRVLTVPYRGTVKVHIREFYLDDEEYKIGRGIAFPVDALEEVIQGLILAQETLEEGAQAIESAGDS